jgi:hypothetical protein
MFPARIALAQVFGSAGPMHQLRTLPLGLLFSCLCFTTACQGGSEPAPAPPDTTMQSEAPVLPGVLAKGACIECDFRLSPVAEVGSELDTIFPKPRGSGVVSAANHRFYTCPISERGRIGEYAPTGGLVGVRGKYGEGPGEARACYQIAVSGQSLVTLGGDRLLWSEHFGDSARTIRLPTVPRAPRMIVLPDSTVVIMHAGPPTGALLVIKDPTRVAEAFEFDSDVASEGRLTQPLENSIWLAPGRVNTFFLVNEFFAPRLEEWGADGLLRRWTLHAPWFWEYDADDLVRMVQEGVTSAAAVPRTMAIRVDSGGRLWSLTLVPQINPVEPHQPPPEFVTEPGHPVVAPTWGVEERGTLDAILAVYQLTDSSANLLAYARVDPALRAFADDSTAYEQWVTDQDLVVYRMFRFRPPQELENLH